MDHHICGERRDVSCCQRSDADRRDVVDLGIAMQGRDGTIPAVEFLRSRNIAAGVIRRVLGEPGRRRAPSS
jgi:hypothetical protein